MQFRTIRNLALLLLFCTSLTWAEEDQSAPDAGGCRQVAGQLPQAASTFGRGLAMAPRDAVRPSNLKWELPIAAATGLLIVSVDTHVNNHIHSASFAQDAARGSNVGLGIELGAAGLAYLWGCSGHRSPYMASSGFTALEAMGAASVGSLRYQRGHQPPVRLFQQYAWRVLGGWRLVSFRSRCGKLCLCQRDCSPLSKKSVAQMGCLRTCYRRQFRAGRR